MNNQEKIRLIQVLLKDISLQWSPKSKLKERVCEAKELCEELGGDFDILAEKCNIVLKYIDQNDERNIDGRFFRQKFPYGYEGMDELHNLSRALAYRSDEFKQCVKDLINEDHIFQWHLFSDKYKIMF